MTRFSSLLASTLLTRFLGRQPQPPAPIEQPPAAPKPAWRAPPAKTEPVEAAEAIGILDLAEHGYAYGRATPSPDAVRTAWLTLERISLPLT